MSSSASWYGVHPSEIPTYWPHARPLIEKFLRRQTGYDHLSVYRALMLGEMHLWLVHDDGKVRAAVVTKFNQYPLEKVCLILGLGGEGMKDWLHLLPQSIEPWAKSMGCSAMRVEGRKGWARKLGWQTRAVVLRKELRDG